MQNTDKNVLNAKQLGERIRKAREAKGMSQETLAHLIDKDQKAISGYERGTRRLYVIELSKIALALELPVLYFFEDEFTEYDIEHELLKYFHDLPTQQSRQTALEYLRLLVETLDHHTAS